MKTAVIVLLFTSVMAEAQGFFLSKPDQPDVQHVTYIAVMAVRVVDSTSSYLMVCSESHPDCNTAYTFEDRYIPFTSEANALAYLNSTKDIFMRLLKVQTAPIVAKETVTPIHHPDTQDKSVHYSIGK